MTRIAVVGAGISGMSCAWYLQQLIPGVQIDLIESSDRVGGVIQTHYEDPYLVETGADNLATLIPDGLQFIQALGLRDQFIHPNSDYRFAQVVRGGRIFPIPNGFSLMQPTQMGAILGSPILSLPSRLRILGEYFIPPRVSNQDESVESFAVRRLGRECFDRLVEPIVGGIFTARAETLSMKASMAQFLAMEKEHGSLIRAAIAKRKSEAQADKTARKATGARYDQFIAPKQGMSWWMNAIKSQINAHFYFGTTVTRVLRQTGGKCWSLESSSNDVNNKTYDHVLIATPSWSAAQMLKETHSRLATLLERIPYASSAVAVLAIPKSEIRSDAMCFGIVVPKVEHRNSLAISLTSEKYPGRAPSDTVLARVFMGGAVRPEIFEMADKSLLEIAQSEVRDLLGVKSLPKWHRLVRWKEAMPQYLVGHCELIAEIRTQLEQTPGLSVIGNAFEGVGIPQCIRVARQTAERIAGQWNGVA